jgi:hypothetical protein
MDWVHLEHVAGEAVLAGILAFAATYSTTQNLQASIMAGILAAGTKSLPPSMLAGLMSGTPPPTSVK